MDNSPHGCNDNTYGVFHSDNSAEIAPVRTESRFGFRPSLDVSQCSNQTKRRILFGKIDRTDFND